MLLLLQNMIKEDQHGKLSNALVVMEYGNNMTEQ